MIVDSSSIFLSSQHSLVEKNTRLERVKAWFGAEEPKGEGKTSSFGKFDPTAFSGKIQQLAGGLKNLTGGSPKSLLDSAVQVDLSAQAKLGTLLPQDDLAKSMDDLQLLLIQKLFKKITGEKFEEKISSFGEDFARAQQQSSEGMKALAQALSGVGTATAGSGQAARVGWGVEAQISETHFESEELNFSANGLVRTKDGKEIVISVDLSMSRKFIEEKSLSIRMGDAALKDPLVVNFSGNAADLSGDTISFDIDANGKAETVSSLKPGSGFLALDSNGDGVVTNGAELFGAKTGEGFKELAVYDVDKNGWIDEADPIYQRLKIWSMDGAGNSVLSTLAEKGVGAISLASAATPFQYKSLEDNSLQGAVRSTGIFLGEDGRVGTVQQVDLAVRSPNVSI